MSYILMKESLFRALMGRLTDQTVEVNYRFGESDYWMNGKEVCEYLNISQGMLNGLRNNNLLFCCRIKDVYHYKRAEVHRMKSDMDRELVESGAPLGGCRIINTEAEAIRAFESGADDLQAGIEES